MAKLKLVERSVDSADLTDKERRFCHEYIVDHNGTQAAIRAGYSGKTAQVMASKLLSRKRVARMIGVLERQALERIEFKVETVLEQLRDCVTRDSGDFIDETGKLIPANELSLRARRSVDAIEQEVITLRNADGEEIGEKVKTKVRLVPKAAAIDMAMKHFGAYAAEKQEMLMKLQQSAKLDWDKLCSPVEEEGDLVEARIANPELRRLQDASRPQPKPVVEITPAEYTVQELADDQEG